MSDDLLPTPSSVSASTRRTDLAHQFFAKVMRSAPWLRDEPAYDVAVVSWALAEATCRLLQEQSDREPDDRGLRTELRQWQAHAARLRTDLGLTPLSRGKVASSTSATEDPITRLRNTITIPLSSKEPDR